MTLAQNRISVTPVAASISTQKYKILTSVFELPGPLLPELLTHREASRNLTSFRAMPVSQALKMTGFRPLHFGKAQPGMQSLEEELDDLSQRIVMDDWAELEEKAKIIADKHFKMGLAKQYSNRPLAPFCYVRGVLTGTSNEPNGWPFANLLHLRAKSQKAEPHMHEFAWCLADAIHKLNEKGTFKMSVGGGWTLKEPGQWHLPFIGPKEPIGNYWNAAFASAMRCARASYNKLDGGAATVEEDAADAKAKLLDGADIGNLSSALDLHGSPFEHQARCPEETNVTTIITQRTFEGLTTKTFTSDAIQSGNLRGWEQFRHVLGIKPGTFTDEDYQKGRLRQLRG